VSRGAFGEAVIDGYGGLVVRTENSVRSIVSRSTALSSSISRTSMPSRQLRRNSCILPVRIACTYSFMNRSLDR
jgi:hypothetical protein